MYRDLTKGSILRSLLLFALPMLAGDILQQLYNIADTLIVSRVIGRDALAAVGSAYTLMIFLTSILLGLSMGAGALFSVCRGRGDESGLRRSIVHAFALIGVCTLVLTALAYALLPAILRLLQVPEGVSPLMRTYLAVIFAGIPATFLYNFFACLLRSVGNSLTRSISPGWGLPFSHCGAAATCCRKRTSCALTVRSCAKFSRSPRLPACSSR